MAAAAIEIIIALKFNLLRYPEIPLGIADITWARALLLISLGLFAGALARYRRVEPTAARGLALAVLGLVAAALDAVFGFDFARFAAESSASLDPSILRIGEFNLRVIPCLALLCIFLALALTERDSDGNPLRRWSVVGGLAMGIIGMLAVLPGLRFEYIGIGGFNVRDLFADQNRLFRGSFQIGPASPTHVFYAGMFLLASFITVLTLGSDEKDDEGATRHHLMWLDWVALAAVAWSVFQYIYVGIEKMSFSVFDANTAVIGCVSILYLCYRVYGAALAICGLVAFAYFFVCGYLPGIFNAEYGGYVSVAENLWFNNNKAVLGSKLGILLNNVLPFIVFGALLSATGAAKSLIKLSFLLMRNTKGGPAHAAVLASGLFGSVSGSAVSNVVGTGVITIPMIKRRGYTAEFAGGVEATASTGGQIMPPIMGAAALVMADLTGTAYLNIMIAALVPALAYYLSLFVTVVFESRRMGMEPQALDDLEEVSRQDTVNVVLLVLVPLAIVIWRLIQGASPAGSAVTAILALILLSAVSPTVRERPVVLLRAIAAGGVTFGRLLMVVGVVGIIVGVMSTTDLPSKLGREISDVASVALVLTLAIAAVVSLLLGMGMPTLPAYLTVIIILGPALNSLGLSVMASHMFVFYYGVASAITPPVAVAAFAAAAVAEAKPVATGVTAVRIGIVIFAVPFMFALNPDMLIVPEAFEDGEVFSPLGLLSVLLRTAGMIYLFASATSRFDRVRMPNWEILVRFGLALLLVSPSLLIHGPAAAAAIAIVVFHYIQGQTLKQKQNIA
ncbi:TRAP transporter fused permease subunit [Psychromarinibacter sp. C21-152]|uniref:TRAP transporter fused permease subunit n=1 Tax=Psychromarinibacter sediminicola TaxID=3033385 RepID=A0AAE3NRM9_9RHOB|nr:TRAP transporter fused permease subunit [Psychromarinibacter sediminicola]MDF0601219.1 TRAP transporter fused permease subunit [Psychromarinibacter sediminicola]